MSIRVGDRIPSCKLMAVGAEGHEEVLTDQVLAGRAVLFAVPGAFTPTCSARHLPSFVDNLEAFRAKGVDRVACMAVNDIFVVTAWARAQGVPPSLLMLADGSAAFTKMLGLELDLTARGLGIRSQRFALIAQDLIITHLAVEAPGGYDVSSAEAVLAHL